jgi:hypothetical protein
MDLQRVRSGGMDLIEPAQDNTDILWAFVNAVMNLRVPQNAGNFLTSLKPVSSLRTVLHAASIEMPKPRMTKLC